MNLPRVAILLVTYNRPDEARQVINALYQNIHYAGELTLHIADDCSPEPYGYDLRVWAQNHTQRHVALHRTQKNVGWGANVNRALGSISENVILQIEDDYVLHHIIDITPYIVALMVDAEIGLVRLDGIAGHRVTAHAGECDISKGLPDYRAGLSTSIGRLFYWRLDVDSPEMWVYSNRPHLKHRRFHHTYGLYPEGYKLGMTEEKFAHTVKDIQRRAERAPHIIVPMELGLPGFDHIGDSYQHTELDKGKVR